jgi:PAS domain S-box-containing protein
MPETEAKRTKKFRSLATSLTVIFLFFSLTIILISNGLQLYFNFQTQQQTIANQQYLIAENAANSVKSFAEEKFSMLETVASVGLVGREQEEQKNAIDKLLGREPSFRQLALLDEQNEEIIEVSRLSAAAPEKLQERFNNDLFDEVKQGKRYFSSVYIDEITSEPIGIMAVSVRNVFGDFKGILAAEVNLKFTWDLVASIKVGEKGLTYVVDKKGNLIGFSDISRVLKGENLSQLVEVDQFIKNEGAPDKNKIDIGKGIQGTIAVSTYVPLGTPDWAVVVELPFEEAYAGMIYQLEFTGIIIILIIGLGAVAGRYLSKRITNPIINLRDVAEEISGGKLETRAEIQSSDEIGQLAKSFNDMAARLSIYTKELENKVAERTEELNKKLKELTEINKDIKQTQSAMINLVEDARILEMNLKKERDRVQGIITSMGEGLIVVDDRNKIVLLNPLAEKLLGVSVDKLHGHNIMDALPLYLGDLKVDIEDHPITKAMKSGKTIITKLDENFYFKKVGGKKFVVTIVAAPLMEKEKGIAGAVLMFRDASEEKRLDEAKTSFISISSHQLRTPLTSMRWFSEMLMTGDAGPINKEQRHFVERIYQGTDRMISLVNLLLQIARVEAGRVKIEPVPVDLKAVTQGVLVTLRKSLEEKGQKVTIKSDPEPFPLIPMDQEVVWQVIQNLLSNASRYSPEKSTILVSIIEKDRTAQYSVKDEGIGIPKDQQNKIFEKFYRAENALKYVPTGSGLGLSLVKLLVEGWGGKIWFESEEGEGATFYFTVPLEGMKAKEGEVKISV